MQYISRYQSPMGEILLAADEIGLTGLWFEGQKYFALYLEKEHEEKENQKSIPEPFAFHPFWNIFPAGKTKAAAQKAKQLSSATVTITVSLCSLHQ